MPDVGIIMGSDSDLPVMKESAAVLEQLGVSYEMSIVSAHRTPDVMYRYAQTARTRGIRVIIAGAGGAAHLPGMTAALTALPVIGVPIKTSTLNGLDSLYSIVQMPAGIPVAAVAINNGVNAGLLAARILSVFDESLSGRLESYQRDMAKSVEYKAERLMSRGYKEYLS
ncbi:MAG: 5-(carboxyamino)imidazole ribonucleotide mutase [Clostridiales bacterium]|jgi:5-(carboxyamino)imidazole ribonucleotide mutase|nr:5-(carboxyamino)imidazole ribonucleotide mutase [Clostridiales bacterium]